MIVGDGRDLAAPVGVARLSAIVTRMDCVRCPPMRWHQHDEAEISAIIHEILIRYA